MLRTLDLRQSITNPAVWYRPGSVLKLVVHVDDLLISGNRKEVNQLITDMEQVFKLKKNILGNGSGETKIGEYLGRTLRLTSKGLELEHGSKYVASLVKDFGMVDCKAVTTPMVKEDHSEGPERVDMDPRDARRHRGAVAKVNYLSQDRPDITLASSSLARTMARPKLGDDVRLKRVIRYLKAYPTAVMHFCWQEDTCDFELYTDSDWASCRSTRKSTSGGMILRGRHLVCHWSKIQAKVAPSSGEAELYASNTGLSALAGVVNLDKELTTTQISEYDF